VGLRSLAFDGHTAFGEAADPDGALDRTGDWTVEVWFRDDDPAGFDHPYAYLLNKGDGSAPESPFYVLLGQGSLLAGVRSAGGNHPLTYNLHFAGYSPKIWQHLAATFQASTTTLTLYLNGQRVAQQTLGVRSSGNTLPLEVGRASAVGAKYWRGKLDDLRLWSVVRTPQQIQSAYKTELSGTPPPGLIANWRFDEGCGASATSTGGTSGTEPPGGSDTTPAPSSITLNGAAAWSPDVPTAPLSNPVNVPITNACAP
jgi:hypothetical protein